MYYEVSANFGNVFYEVKIASERLHEFDILWSHVFIAKLTTDCVT